MVYYASCNNKYPKIERRIGMGLHPEALPEVSPAEDSAEEETRICKCGCGKPLEKHGPDDRDDTHRGLQYD